MLRDEVSNIDEFDQNLKKLQVQQNGLIARKNPFSLAKVQFAFWTVVISSSYIYLDLCIGDCADAPINQTALILMGIGAGVAVASNIIDKTEMADNRPRHQNMPSQGFFIDVLSDDNGISIHRFQNLIWTVIAIIIYLAKVISAKSGCSLPELSNTLLLLTGISGATYTVLRAKENDPPANQTAINPNTAPPSPA